MPQGPFGGPRPFAKRQLMPGEGEYDFDINTNKLQKLKEILDKYPSLLQITIRQGRITNRDLVIITYTADKPLSSIRIHDGNEKEFANDMREFFFVYLDDNGKTYISRFKTLIEVVKHQDKVTEHSVPGHTINALSDINADLSGIFYGFDSKNVAGKLQKTEKMEHLLKE